MIYESQVNKSTTSPVTRLDKSQVSKQTNDKSPTFVRTQMCFWVLNGKKCPHRLCRFAHDKDELVYSDCLFGSNCLNVRLESEGVYSAVQGKFCNRKHPGETKASVSARVATTPKKLPPKRVELLSEKKQHDFSDDKFYRTRICNSVGTNNPCPHSKCRYAHNEKELVDIECRFGLACRNVIWQQDGVYLNVKGKYCNHKHPEETKDSIRCRTGRLIPM